MAGVLAEATPRGIRIPADALMARLGGRRAFQRFLSILTVVERPQPGRPKSFARARRTAYRIAKEDAGSTLYVPRAKAAAVARLVEMAETAPLVAEAAADAVAPPNTPLYPYQAVAVEYVCDGPPDVYLQMGTGLGKTRVGLAVAARQPGATFVVVPTKAIRMQWLDEAAEAFPGMRCAAYDNRARTIPAPTTHDLVVGIVNTVRKKDDDFFAGYSAVILDEAHEMHSPKNIRVLWLCQAAPRVLGISATPTDRPDGLDRVVHHFLGEPVNAETDIDGFDAAAANFRGRVREVEYAGDPEYCEAAVGPSGTISAIETIGNMIRDPARLRLVAAEVERLARLHETEDDPGALGLGPPRDGAPPRVHGVFVFAEHRNYLPALREALLERFAPAEIAAPEIDEAAEPVEAAAAEETAPVVLRGGATRDDLGAARRARIVLTTYGYSRRGVSLTDMTALVLATPRRNGMRQILGRVTRRGSDESILRIIVDIKDVRTPLKSQNTARRAVYREKNYPIYRVRVAHGDYAAPESAAPPTSAEELVSSGPAPSLLDAVPALFDED